MTWMKAGQALLLTGLAAVVLAAPVRAISAPCGRLPLGLRSGGVEVATALLLRYYRELPEPREGEGARAWAARQDEGLRRFKKEVGERYGEGTLQRLADHPSAPTRRAALLALHILGTMASNEAIAGRLRDEDGQVRQMAADALWAVWLRGDGEANAKELQRALQQPDPDKALAVLTALIRKAPDFAEAYNQRAILHFQAQAYEKSVADCEKVLQLNKQHFGAAEGLGRCYLRLRLPGPALKAFRTAHRINPNIEGIEDAIRELESVLGEDGK
jgi:tetratricopeptide (TPR) repeat protein